MILRRFLGLVSTVVLGVVLSASPSAAQGTDNYLKLEEITGDVTAQGYEGAIEVLSFSWGLTNTAGATSTRMAAGRATFSDFTVMILTGRALPDLFIKTAMGAHVNTAVFTVVQRTDGKPQERIKLEFDDVLFTSFQVSGASELPTHSLSMSYAKVAMTVWVQKPDGSFEKVGPQSYDLEQRRP